MSVRTSVYAEHIAVAEEHKDDMQLERLNLIIEEGWVDNRPAIVIRISNRSSGGIKFMSMDTYGVFPLPIFTQILGLMTFEFFNEIYHQGCFAAGEYWTPELVNTRFRDIQQLKISSGNRYYFWDHEKKVVRQRGM